MKLPLAFFFTGLILIGVGLALVFASLGLQSGLAGIALFLFGLFTVIASLVAYAFRKPTRKELANQSPGSFQSLRFITWHFRPVGLVILGIAAIGALLLENWVVPPLPGNREPQRHLLAGVMFAILFFVAVSFRKIRNLIFYTGQIARPKRGTRADRSGKENKRGRGSISRRQP